MKLTQLKQTSQRRVVVFGGPKAGKTQFVSGLAAKYDLLWFDLEQGFNTLLKLPPQYQEKVELIRLPDSKMFPIAIETMLKVVSGAPVEICEAHGKVACAICKKDGAPYTAINLSELPATTVVVVDSLTQLANSAMNHITKGKPDDYRVEWDDYRKQGALMEKFLSSIQNARYSIVCITHEAEVEFDDGRKKVVPVAGTREFSRNTARYFDDVIYCEVKNKKHIAASSTAYSNSILTGSRTDVALEKDEKPSLLTIFEAQSKGVDEPKTNGDVALTALQKLKLNQQGVDKK